MERLLRMPEVIGVTGLSRPQIYKMVSDGTFPRQVKLAKRAVAWKENEIKTWIASRVKNSNAAAGGN